MRILGPLVCSSTSPVTATFSRSLASVVTFAPSTTRATGSETFEPGSESSFSTLTTSPTATLYCLPPVLTIAYVAFSAAIVSFFVSGRALPVGALAGLGCGATSGPLSSASAERQLVQGTLGPPTGSNHRRSRVVHGAFGGVPPLTRGLTSQIPAPRHRRGDAAVEPRPDHAHAFDRRLGVPVHPHRPGDERLHRHQVVRHQRHLAPARADVAQLSGLGDVGARRRPRCTDRRARTRRVRRRVGRRR